MKTNSTFEKLCRMSQLGLKTYLKTALSDTHNKVIVEDGFIFAPGTFPVLLVAHLDTVHARLPKKIKYNKMQGSISSPQGIGGDDRCGVYMILEIIRRYNCSVLFCEDEEIGGVGASKFTESEIAKDLSFNYIIELDRKGSNDAVFYDCDNYDFEKFITKEFYKTAFGSFSDISFIAPFLGCAAVNLSCGYYNAHMLSEYVVLNEMTNSINAVCKILERTTDEDVYEYIPAKRTSWFGDCGWNDDDWYSAPSNTDKEYYFCIEYIDVGGRTEWDLVKGHSKAEAVGEFLMTHCELTFMDIIDVDWGDAV